MQIGPAFSEPERDDILRKYWKAKKTYDRLMDDEKYEEADEHDDEADELRSEYFEKLPEIIMSCCPFDNRPLARTMDPYGLDGFWWEDGAPMEGPPQCPHLCVLQGAVHYNGLEPIAGPREVIPGPEVPFVMPRLLEMPGMVAVISSVRMACGYTAFPIAYFAKKRPPVQDLSADWRNTQHVYTTQLGEPGFVISNDVWDFDLAPWLRRGKIRWCPPDSDNTRLSADPPELCPYIDLPGRREYIIVQGHENWTMGLPDGTPISPYE